MNSLIKEYVTNVKGLKKILTRPSIKSCDPILTTEHPIAFAELRQRVWFSFLSQGFNTFFVLIARSSIVPGTATLISLLQNIPVNPEHNSFAINI